MDLRKATIEIAGLTTEKMRMLVEKAKEAGTTPEEYARHLIEEGLSAREKTFDEILAPLRRQVKESGVTDDELDALFIEARKEVFREKRKRG